jgi:hypothetical protein
LGYDCTGLIQYSGDPNSGTIQLSTYLVSGFSINPQVRNGSVPDEPPIIIPPFKVSVVETVQQCIAVNAFSLNAE